MGQIYDKSDRHNQQWAKNEGVLSREHQPSQIRPMGLTCHPLETIRQEKTTSETSQVVERRRGYGMHRPSPNNETLRLPNIDIHDVCVG